MKKILIIISLFVIYGVSSAQVTTTEFYKLEHQSELISTDEELRIYDSIIRSKQDYLISKLEKSVYTNVSGNKMFIFKRNIPIVIFFDARYYLRPFKIVLIKNKFGLQ